MKTLIEKKKKNGLYCTHSVEKRSCCIIRRPSERIIDNKWKIKFTASKRIDYFLLLHSTDLFIVVPTLLKPHESMARFNFESKQQGPWGVTLGDVFY